MNLQDSYTIGEAAEKCGVSKKALRFYDEQGLLRPDKIGENNYRYYSTETLLTIPILKYYKQMGFTLSEMRNFVEGSSLNQTRRVFAQKVDELNIEQNAWYQKHRSVVDWLELIEEAQTVLENNATEVGVKFREKGSYFYMEQPYNSAPMEAIINIEFTNEVARAQNAITGPVLIQFPSGKERMTGTCKSMRLVQKTILPQEASIMEFGGGLYLSCYHIGAHEHIGETYQKMMDWAQTHKYVCGEECFERYVVDYWTTKNSTDFVTEILIDVSR